MQGGDRDIVVIKRLLRLAMGVLVLVMTLVACQLMRVVEQARSLRKISNNRESAIGGDSLWVAPDVSEIPGDDAGDLIRYGRELIEHTAIYLGPKGKVAPMSNGMNCQSCHLKSGTKPFGINYSAVASTYPKFRHRSGTVEGFEKRINDCIERSLNGRPLPGKSREMRAMVAYLQWVGKDVKTGVTPHGAGLPKLDYLGRAADPAKGEVYYNKYCVSCHGANGQGVKHENRVEWLYPPLWGDESYNTGAGLFRLTRLAAFVKANMPYGVDYESPALSTEEAWDVAAYISSMPRPHKEYAGDWPDITQKPVDHPFGPYADGLSEFTHKYGPFKKK